MRTTDEQWSALLERVRSLSSVNQEPWISEQLREFDGLPIVKVRHSEDEGIGSEEAIAFLGTKVPDWKTDRRYHEALRRAQNEEMLWAVLRADIIACVRTLGAECARTRLRELVSFLVEATATGGSKVQLHFLGFVTTRLFTELTGVHHVALVRACCDVLVKDRDTVRCEGRIVGEGALHIAEQLRAHFVTIKDRRQQARVVRIMRELVALSNSPYHKNPFLGDLVLQWERVVRWRRQ